MSDKFTPEWDPNHAMSPQPTFPGLEEFKHWYEQEFVAPKVVGALMCGEGSKFRDALAQYYSQTDNDHGLLACALNVWAKLQRDHEKVLQRFATELEDKHKRIKAILLENDERTAQVSSLRDDLEKASRAFDAEYTAFSAKLDEQNNEIIRLHDVIQNYHRPKKLRAFGKKASVR